MWLTIPGIDDVTSSIADTYPNIHIAEDHPYCGSEREQSTLHQPDQELQAAHFV